MPRLLSISIAALALSLAVSAFAATARAQAQPPSSAALVEEVEVIARLPGPALWRVSTPTSQLWILGLPPSLPRRFHWDTRRLQATLTGARELVLPPGPSVNLGDMLSLAVDRGHVIHLDKGQTLHAALPDDLRARFDAAARAVGQDPAHYDHWRPVFAAMALAYDAGKRQQIDPMGAQNTVAELARGKDVPVRRLANFRIGELARSASRMSPDGSLACMTLAVTMAETLASTTPRMAQAWARGDVLAVNALYAATSPEACFEAAPAAADIRDRVARDWASDLSKALARPGKTVVAVDMASLTRKGGLLDQLRGEGLTVIGPAY